MVVKFKKVKNRFWNPRSIFRVLFRISWGGFRFNEISKMCNVKHMCSTDDIYFFTARDEKVTENDQKVCVCMFSLFFVQIVFFIVLWNEPTNFFTISCILWMSYIDLKSVSWCLCVFFCANEHICPCICVCVSCTCFMFVLALWYVLLVWCVMFLVLRYDVVLCYGVVNKICHFDTRHAWDSTIEKKTYVFGSVCVLVFHSHVLCLL